MSFSPQTTRKIKKIIPHVVIFCAGTYLYLFVERGILGDYHEYPSTGNIYDFKTSLLAVSTVGLAIGAIIGTLEELFFKNVLRNLSYALKVLLKTVLYLLIIVFSLVLFAFPINAKLMGLDVHDPRVALSVFGFMQNFVFFSILIFSGFFISLSLFFSEMVDNIGTKAISNFFTGKYHTSKIEDRIFMFLDMKSSTTTAERLGNEEYYKLLNMYYKDMTEAIINTEGDIYQYVGDEIVISWEKGKGRKNLNCIECFNMIHDKIEGNQEEYLKRFNHVPQFKAGLHSGQVSVGEIGVIKKDVLYMGDVLNTASRIQDLCGHLDSDMLISEQLLNCLDLNHKYTAVDKGEIELRGKDKKNRLFEILPTSGQG